MRALRRPQLLPALAIGIAALVGVVIVSVTAGRLVAFELWPPGSPLTGPTEEQLVVPGVSESEPVTRAARRRPADAGGVVATGTGERGVAQAGAALESDPPTGVTTEPPPPPPPPPPPERPATPVASAEQPLAPVGALTGEATNLIAQTLRSTSGDLGRGAAPVDSAVAGTVTQAGDAVGQGVADTGRAVGDLLGGPGPR